MSIGPRFFSPFISIVLLIVPSLVLPDEARIVYETTIPGYYLSECSGIAVDSNGNAYGIASWYQNMANLDILIFKLDPDGNLLWTVPIVGDELQHDYPEDIILDSENNVWVTGWTDSDAFPTTSDAINEEHIHFRDAFLMKLDPDDGTILYSTYLGGDYTDYGESIMMNEAGEIILVGTTGSTDFPTTPDANQDEPSAPLYIYTDTFIMKLSHDGRNILYSSYFGGFKDDMTYDAALDDEGNICFTGGTNADDFPLMNPIQSDPNGIFVSKFSPDGTTLLFSTYLGAEDVDHVNGLTTGPDGSVTITGYTRSIAFPTTPGAFEEEFVGEILGCEEGFPGVDVNCEDAFVTRMATDGTGLIYSTFLGGTSVDKGSDVAVDLYGRCYNVGYTVSQDFPGAGGGFAAIYVTKFNPDGSDLLYTHVKQSGSAGAGHGITVDSNGDVYFTGAANVPAEIYVAKLTDDVLDLTDSLSAGVLELLWTPHPLASAYWVYGAANNPYFEAEFSPDYINRLAILPAGTTSWFSSNGIVDVEVNWSYRVIAVDESEQEFARSNDVGEYDFGTDIP